MNAYYVESWAGWFVVLTSTKRRARKVGVQEFGRGNVRSTRPASPGEVQYYIGQKGKSALSE